MYVVHFIYKLKIEFFIFESQTSKNLKLCFRKLLNEKGREGYKASMPESRNPFSNKARSPVSTLKNPDRPAVGLSSTTKSTSTISEILNAKKMPSKNGLRADFALYDTRDLGK